jgi:hypothetical protein
MVKQMTDLSQVTDKLYHVMLYTSPWSRFKLTSVAIGTDCIGSKSNYHTITAYEKGYDSRNNQPSVKSVLYAHAQIMGNQDTQYE